MNVNKDERLVIYLLVYVLLDYLWWYLEYRKVVSKVQAKHKNGGLVSFKEFFN